MTTSKKFGKIILITLCITTILFVYKSGFDDEDCDAKVLELLSPVRHLITKAQKDIFCNSIAIKNLAGADVQNAIDFLANQTQTLVIDNVGKYIGLSDDPASVVIYYVLNFVATINRFVERTNRRR